MNQANPGEQPGALRFLAPALLVAIAILQVALAHTTSLSPWRGGGFGMFATIDYHETRTLRVEGAVAGGDRVPLRVEPGGWGPDAELELRVRHFPTSEALTRLAERVLEKKVRRSAAGDALVFAPTAGDELTRVRVEVWGIVYDQASHEVRTRLLASPVEIARGGTR